MKIVHTINVYYAKRRVPSARFFVRDSVGISCYDDVEYFAYLDHLLSVSHAISIPLRPTRRHGDRKLFNDKKR